MHARRVASAMLVAVLFHSVLATCHAQDRRDPKLVAERHKGILERLDPGGDLLLVVNVDGLLEEMVGKLIELTKLVPAEDAEAQAIFEKIRRIPAFLKRNGLYAAQGIGASIVPRTDGLNDMKIFLQRNQKSAGLPLWRGFFGGNQRRLTGLDLLPDDTVLVRLCNADIKPLWQLVRPTIAEFGTDETVKSFDAALGAASEAVGMNVGALINSFGDECFISVQLSKTETVSLPTNPQQPLTLPMPSLLVGLAVKDASLAKLIKAQLDKAAASGTAIPTVLKTVGGVQVTTLNVPIPAPFPVEPTYCEVSGYFLLGSNRRVVEKAITASAKKTGLAASPAFKKAFLGLSMKNNGLFYVSPRFGKTIADLMQASVERASPPAASQPALSFVMEQLDRFKTMSHAMVFQNYSDGVLMSGTTTASGREMIAGIGIAPMGMLAAIAVPSFVKARESAKRAACVNNLRMLDMAKQQWALEEGKNAADVPGMGNLAPFIDDVRRVKCPNGGNYTIRSIGEKPTCSDPAHRL